LSYYFYSFAIVSSNIRSGVLMKIPNILLIFL